MPTCDTALPLPKKSRSPGRRAAGSLATSTPSLTCSRDVRGSTKSNLDITHCTSPLQSKALPGVAAPSLYLRPTWPRASSTSESRAGGLSSIREMVANGFSLAEKPVCCANTTPERPATRAVASRSGRRWRSRVTWARGTELRVDPTAQSSVGPQDRRVDRAFQSELLSSLGGG